MTMTSAEIDIAIKDCINSKAQIEFVGGKEPEDNIVKLVTTSQSAERETFSDLLKAIADMVFPNNAKWITVYRGGIAEPTLMSPMPWVLFRIYSENKA